MNHVINGEKQTLSIGELVFFRLKDKHYYYQAKEETVFRDIMFKKDFFESSCSFFDEDFLDRYNSPHLPVKTTLTMDQMAMIEQSATDFSKISPLNNKEKMIKAKFILSYLLSLFHGRSDDIKSENAFPPIIVDILERMNMSRHYKESLSTMLSYFQYNQSYLCRLFKKHIGVTMTEYLNNMKLNYVASQLKITKKTITELSNEVGFSCVAHLNKLFLKKFGMTPSHYKKQTR
jgi:AraC family cel operon transcriptional repressor